MATNVLKPNKRTFFLYLTPGIVWYCFVMLFPLYNALKYSFFQWSGGVNKTFIGFENYKRLISDELFWSSFKNNVIITLLCVVGQIGIALLIASILNSRFMKLKNFHRAVIFFPVILSTVIIGFIWTLMYSKDFGLINWFLEFLHLDFLIKPWLDDPKQVILSVSSPLIWQYIGYYMVILMAGMTNISREVYEMAELDGATGWKQLLYITLPLLKNTILVCIMLCIAGNMQVFSHIFVMTGGGPGNSSMVMAMYSYNKSFTEYQLGYGSTISIGILVLSLSIVLILRRFMGGSTDES